MIKNLKITFLVIALSLAVGVGHAFAATGVTYANDTTILINGRSYTIASGSTATSVVLGGSGNTTLVVNMTSSGPFTLFSLSGDTLAPSGGLLTTCNGGSSVVTIPANTPTTTFTPTSASVCVSSPNGSGGFNGGGSTYVPPATTTTSSSGTSSTPAVTVTTTSTTPTVTTISGCNGRTTGFSTVTGQSCSGNTATVTVTTPVVITGCAGTTGFSTVSGQSCANNGMITTTTASYNFGTVTLKNGSKGDAVRQLQMFLNKYLKLSLTVDGKLGPKTVAVIKAWQKANGLIADGLIGPKTKAMMNTYASTH